MSFDKTIEELTERFNIIKQENGVDKLQKLQEINSELLFFKEEIQAQMEISYQQALTMNGNIDEITGQTNVLQTKVTGLKNKDAGSIQMYDDVHKLYNQQLIGNWAFIFVLSYAGYIFSKQQMYDNQLTRQIDRSARRIFVR